MPGYVKNGRFHRSPAKEMPSGALILKWMDDDRVYTANDLQEFLMGHGYCGSTSSTVTYKMMKEGDILKVKRGHYMKR